MSFQPGDMVIRKAGKFKGMRVGDIDIVTSRFDTKTINLERFGNFHAADKFELTSASKKDVAADNVNHPAHYNSHPSGVECIEVARHHNFNIGNVFKYLWRLGLKGQDAGSKEKRLEEIDKAIFYLKDERKRIEDER